MQYILTRTQKTVNAQILATTVLTPAFRDTLLNWEQPGQEKGTVFFENTAWGSFKLTFLSSHQLIETGSQAWIPPAQVIKVASIYRGKDVLEVAAEDAAALTLSELDLLRDELQNALGVQLPAIGCHPLQQKVLRGGFRMGKFICTQAGIRVTFPNDAARDLVVAPGGALLASGVFLQCNRDIKVQHSKEEWINIFNKTHKAAAKNRRGGRSDASGSMASSYRSRSRSSGTSSTAGWETDSFADY